MKCPLLGLDHQNRAWAHKADFTECLKEKCAWWRDDISICAIKDLSLELGYTQLRLADIADRMPIPRQE